MRRSGSSCLLLPRGTISPSDSSDQQEQLTVTMVTTNRLPSYSIERYYMLSEIEEHSHSIFFLGNTKNDPSSLSSWNGAHKAEKETIDFKIPSSFTVDEMKNPASDKNGVVLSKKDQTSKEIPSHVMLYLLWKPKTYHSPRDFVESAIVKAVCKLVSLYEENPSARSPSPPPPPPPSSEPPQSPTPSGSPSFQLPQTPSSPQNKASISPPPVKIYLVVDKISQPIPEWNDPSDAEHMNEAHREDKQKHAAEAHHAVETKAAEDLARLVAKSTTLRPLVEGITVGVTTEIRAAPALETVLSAVSFGSRERRRHLMANRSKHCHTFSIDVALPHRPNEISLKSIIGVVAMNSDELTGLDPEKSTDAVDKVIQSVTCAEWNGNGDYKSFASRAHEVWKRRNGCDTFDERDYDELQESVSTAMVFVFLVVVIGYLWNKYGGFVTDYVLMFL